MMTLYLLHGSRGLLISSERQATAIMRSRFPAVTRVLEPAVLGPQRWRLPLGAARECP
jgi:hypothetical protein